VSHGPHEALPGHAPGQILHDGCAECEWRAAGRDLGIGALDAATFARAWQRAVTWQREEQVRPSAAETPLLAVLWAVQVQLERAGVPLGVLPCGITVTDGKPQTW